MIITITTPKSAISNLKNVMCELAIFRALSILYLQIGYTESMRKNEYKEVR